MNQDVNVLYVDDETDNLASFRACFRRHFNIFTASSAKEAEFVLSRQEIHVLITDQKMPGTTGTQLLENAVNLYPLQTRIMLTAYSDNEAVFHAFHRGLIYRYMLKPWNEEELRDVISKAGEVYKLNRLKDELYQEWLKTNEDLEILKKQKGLNN